MKYLNSFASIDIVAKKSGCEPNVAAPLGRCRSDLLAAFKLASELDEWALRGPQALLASQALKQRPQSAPSIRKSDSCVEVASHATNQDKVKHPSNRFANAAQKSLLSAKTMHALKSASIGSMHDKDLKRLCEKGEYVKHFMHSVFTNDSFAVKKLLSNRADPNYSVPATLNDSIHGSTPLHWLFDPAADDASRELVELLLRAKACSTSEDVYGQTPMDLAVARGNERCFAALAGCLDKGCMWSETEKGAHVDGCVWAGLKLGIDHHGGEAEHELFNAVSANDFATTQDVLMKGASPMWPNPRQGNRTACQIAATTEMLTILVNGNLGSFHAYDITGNTIVHSVAAKPELLQTLMNERSDMFKELLDTPNVAGKTPLHEVIEQLDPADPSKSLKLLLEAGARVDIMDMDGYTPLKRLKQISQSDNVKKDDGLKQFKEVLRSVYAFQDDKELLVALQAAAEKEETAVELEQLVKGSWWKLGVLDLLFDPRATYDQLHRKKLQTAQLDIYNSVVAPLRRANSECTIGRTQKRLLRYLFEVTSGGKQWKAPYDPRELYRAAYDLDNKDAMRKFKTILDNEYDSRVRETKVAAIPFLEYMPGWSKPAFVEMECSSTPLNQIVHLPELQKVLRSGCQSEMLELLANYGVVQNFAELWELVSVGTHRWFKRLHPRLLCRRDQFKYCTVLILRAVAEKVQTSFQAVFARHFPTREGGLGHHQSDVKSCERMIEKVDEYKQEWEGKLGRAFDEDCYETRSLAGFILDVVRCSIVAADKLELHEMIEKIESFTIERDGVVVARRKNGYSAEYDGGTGGFRDIKYIFMMHFGPDVCPVPMFGEVQLTFLPFLKVKGFMHLEYSCERGDFDTAYRKFLSRKSVLP